MAGLALVELEQTFQTIPEKTIESLIKEILKAERICHTAVGVKA